MGRPPQGWMAGFQAHLAAGDRPRSLLCGLLHGLAFLGTPSESESVACSLGPFTPRSQSCTPSLLFARVRCEVLPRSGAEQELPLLPLEGRRMEEFVDPFLNPCSLSDSNEQGKETRVPELSEEKGTIVCEQGGQRGDTSRVTLNQRPGGRKRSSDSEIEKGLCQPAGTRERAGLIREDPGLRPEQLEAKACFLR